ncbi:MAG: hypothetical protein ACREQF_06215 [Candidatus Binataceae bacterium]
MIASRVLVARVLVWCVAGGMLALFGGSCSSSSDAALQTGMTADQAVASLGQPDLRDSLSNPAGATRLVWLKSGKAAIVGSDNRIASIQDVASAAGAPAGSSADLERPPPVPRAFDPINTPLNYATYPFKVAVIYFATGLNCLAAGPCRIPVLPDPNSV